MKEEKGKRKQMNGREERERREVIRERNVSYIKKTRE